MHPSASGTASLVGFCCAPAMAARKAPVTGAVVGSRSGFSRSIRIVRSHAVAVAVAVLLMLGCGF